MGIAYILLGVFTPLLNRDISEIFPSEAGNGPMARAGRLSVVLTKMTYGVVCFAMLLSFTGTVLGGIWADQSWGRFWGWDPKENGALLIVIWNALILHARWGGMVKQRGLAALAVFGNIITAWSWFGTNLLGIGLHAYGFIKGAMFGMVAFDLCHLAIIGLALLPLTQWRSFRPASSTKPHEPAPELVGAE
jgi:ABC-type transport system involved in cytochrome c biogenesis permease subunit